MIQVCILLSLLLLLLYYYYIIIIIFSQKLSSSLTSEVCVIFRFFGGKISILFLPTI